LGGELRSDLISGRRKGKTNRKKLERFEVKRIGDAFGRMLA
jgi:hypothetical protein